MRLLQPAPVPSSIEDILLERYGMYGSDAVAWRRGVQRIGVSGTVLRAAPARA